MVSCAFFSRSTTGGKKTQKRRKLKQVPKSSTDKTIKADDKTLKVLSLVLKQVPKT
jgi:hypothetical protein